MTTDIQHVHKFWLNVYDSDHHDAAQAVMADMEKFYSSPAGDSYKVRDVTQLPPGSVLAARFKDGAFHRAVLRCVLPHNSLVRLEYVDYGTVDIQ